MRGFLSFLAFLFVLSAAASDAWAAMPLAPAARTSYAGERGDAAVVAAGEGRSVGTSSAAGYVLGTGDRIKLVVYGEADLSGEYEVGSTGVVALPLIGDVLAAGQPLRAFEQAVRTKLAEGYLRDPRVSAQVVNYRPFFILGEVSKPGSYPYVNGMTIINAIALAGGYTYRADKDGVTISHASDPEKKDLPATEEATVMPGDIIRVPERFF